MTEPYNIAVPAERYSFNELAEIYNQTRVDYIVPMPMNGKRMEEYVRYYDVDLKRSVVATTEHGQPIGIAMLGIRDERAWITRLGVVPNMRERRIGSFLMSALIDNSRQCNARQVQLEVILGNDPARNMFEKFGFQATRELLVIRRPPKPPPDGTRPLILQLRELAEDEIPGYLATREPGPTWVEETPSLLNAGNLRGIEIQMGDGIGWAVFMATPLQIQHIVLNAAGEDYDQLSFAVLYFIHQLYPNRDTKVENIPSDHPVWQAYHALGYVISFRRVEMILHL